MLLELLSLGPATKAALVGKLMARDLNLHTKVDISCSCQLFYGFIVI